MISKLVKEDLIIIMHNNIKLNGTFINGKQPMILLLNTQLELTKFLEHLKPSSLSSKESLPKRERPKSDDCSHVMYNSVLYTLCCIYLPKPLNLFIRWYFILLNNNLIAIHEYLVMFFFY